MLDPITLPAAVFWALTTVLPECQVEDDLNCFFQGTSGAAFITLGTDEDHYQVFLPSHGK